MERLSGAAVAALLLLAGCEQEIDVTLDVTVPVDVQALYARQAPGRLVAALAVPKGGSQTWTLGYLCDPAESPLTATVRHRSRGCAAEGVVRAWIVPLAALPEGASCGLQTRPIEDAPARLDDMPQAEAAIFEGNAPQSGCESAQVSLSLVLER